MHVHSRLSPPAYAGFRNQVRAASFKAEPLDQWTSGRERMVPPRLDYLKRQIRAREASSTGRFLLGAAAGAAVAAAGSLALAASITPLGALLMLTGAAVGGVLGRDGKDANFDSYIDFALQNQASASLL